MGIVRREKTFYQYENVANIYSNFGILIYISSH